MAISLTGSLNISGSNTLIGTKTITGSVFISGSKTIIGTTSITGSLLVTGSLNTVGTITATTLVVQTITSSISSITGSTNFGSLSSNTHTFTGSINVSGSGNFSGSLNLGGYLAGQGTNPGGLGGSRYVLDWHSGNMRIFSYGADSSTNGGFVLNSQRSDGTNSQNYLSIAASTGAATFTGSIGVGNVTPYSILSLPSGTGWNGGLSWNYTTANSASKRWWINTDQITYGDFRICVEQTQGGGTISSAGTLYERLYINSTGSVGIGTTSPSFQLDVFPGVANTTIRAGSYAIMQSVTTNQAMFGLNVAYATSIGTGWRYINTDYATAIRMYSGDIIFHLAASGATTTQPANWDTTDAKMTIKNNGTILIGKSTDTYTIAGYKITSGGESYNTIINSINTLHVYDVTNSLFRFYVSGGGTINATNTAISAISDVRLKENIVDLEIGLDSILALKPRKFDWKKESGNNGKNVRGFIAQEFEQVFPDLIDESINPSPEGEEPYKQIRQDLIPVLVKAIQELTARVQYLENK